MNDVIRQLKEMHSIQGGQWEACPMMYDGGVEGDDEDWIVYEVGGGGIMWDMNKQTALYVAQLHNHALFLIEQSERYECVKEKADVIFKEEVMVPIGDRNIYVHQVISEELDEAIDYLIQKELAS